MPTLRTRFKKEIIAEFLPPKRPSQKVIILCVGMPGSPSKKELLEFFSNKGYWVFAPRYRGSWESGGIFLARSPHEDVLDIIDELPKGVTSLWDGKKFELTPQKIFIFGGSFGGPAALLCSRDTRVNKVVTVSSVVDWKARSRSERLDWLYGAIKSAFGEAYRIQKKNWNKLKTGKFYNPMFHAKEFDPQKILVIHAKDDEVVGFKSVQNFLKKVKCESIILKKGGHFSLGKIMEPRLYKKVKIFLKTKI